MSPDPLHLLFQSLDEPGAVFGAGELDQPVARVRGRLESLGLLAPAEPATHIACPNCDDGHVEAVLSERDDAGHVRFWITCPESMMIEIEPSQLVSWKVNLPCLTKLLRGTLGLAGRQQEFIAGRLWELGGVLWEGAKRRVLFAVGLHWTDGHTVAHRCGTAGKAVVLVPSIHPPAEVWSGMPPAIVALVGAWTDSDLGPVFDTAALTAAVREADELNRASREGLIADPKLKDVVRRIMRQETVAGLTDEALTAAYRVAGTYQRAADKLSEQGYPTNRWAVERAVRRAGGRQAVIRGGSSQSIQRVASRKREGRKKA